MNKKTGPSIINSLIEAINKNDLAALDKVFTEDVVLDWPQSGERIKGGENRRAVYSRFPSLPKVKPIKIRGSENFWVLEAFLNYEENDQYQCVFIFELKDDLIAKETAYWAKPFPAPEWRTPWVEHIQYNI